jgi:hypothetical protein
MFTPEGNAVFFRDTIGGKFNNTTVQIRHARHANKLKPFRSPRIAFLGPAI